MRGNVKWWQMHCIPNGLKMILALWEKFKITDNSCLVAVFHAKILMQNIQNGLTPHITTARKTFSCQHEKEPAKSKRHNEPSKLSREKLLHIPRGRACGDRQGSTLAAHGHRAIVEMGRDCHELGDAMNQPLPSIFHAKFGNLRFVQQRGSREWSAECPVCGDGGHVGNDYPDRFRIFYDDKPLGWCRRCGHTEFADGDSYRPTPEQIAEMQATRAQLAQREAQRLQTKIQELQEGAYWEAWNQSMNEQARQLWRNAGIPDTLQDYWELGYRAEYKGRGFTSEAMTIPYFKPGREIATIQYRLLQPPKPSDKYRFETGLKSNVWLADPDETPSGPCLLVEGMKKAGVCFYQMVERGRQRLNVVAVPSKSPNTDMLSVIKDCEPVYVALDPDAYETEKGKPSAVSRLVKTLKGRAKVVKLPVKPDDFFTLHGGQPSDMLPFLDQAVSA